MGMTANDYICPGIYILLSKRSLVVFRPFTALNAPVDIYHQIITLLSQLLYLIHQYFRIIGSKHTRLCRSCIPGSHRYYPGCSQKADLFALGF